MYDAQSESTPATPTSGWLRWFRDTTQKILKTLDDNGMNLGIPGVLGTTTTSVSSTTTAETKSLVGTIVGTFTVKANHSIIGKKFRLKCKGVITTGGTAGTITIQILWGATVIASTGAVAPTISQSNMYWEAECDITVRTIGGTGTVFCQGNFHVQIAATPSAGVNWPIRGNNADPPAVVTIDSTTDKLIDFQSITSNAFHTVTCNMADLEVLN